jgi:putative ubiquitin-RnfH superfamily antitoxin RatB of RatAB toxin-antitoxin module
MADVIRVSVLYGDAQVQIEKWVELTPDSTVADAIRASDIVASLPEAFVPAAIGIYGRLVEAEHRLRDGDRVELYRPLHVDPKQARRLRAEAGKTR